MISLGTAGRWFSGVRGPAWWKGGPEGGYADAFEIVCCDCGDHPDLDYTEVSPELRQVRGPYLIADGIAAYRAHVELYHPSAPSDSPETGAAAGRPGMNAEFFALAFLAAVNPKLLALDLLLIENRRPRAMLWLLVGGLVVGVTIGLLDNSSSTSMRSMTKGRSARASTSPSACSCSSAAHWSPTGRVHGRRKAPVPAGDRPPGKPGKPENKKEKKDSWAQRLLAEPRLGLAVLVGAVIGIPGASYLTALHHLVAGKYSTAIEVIAVFVFVIISFLLIIIPFAFLELRPEATKARLKGSQLWLGSHTKQLIAVVALLLGAYLAMSAM